MNIYFDILLGRRLGLRAGGVGKPHPVERGSEVVEGDAAVGRLRDCPSALLYGSASDAGNLVGRLIRGSDDLIALVNCEWLQGGHRQIAVNRALGDSSYENIERLGFLPDLIVARCGSLDEAAGLLQWQELGPRLICILEPGRRDHVNWAAAGGFRLQLFCGADGALVAATSSPRSPSSLPPSPPRHPSSP